MTAEVKVAQSCPTLQSHGILQARILEWVDSPFSRGSSLHRDWTQVSHIAGRFFTTWATGEAQGWLECVACPFSSGSSWPRNWTRVSCIAGGFFTSWATRDPPSRKFGDFLRIPQGMCSLGLLSYGWSRAHRLLHHFFAACTSLSCYTCLDVWGSAFSILALRSAPHFQPFWR